MSVGALSSYSLTSACASAAAGRMARGEGVGLELVPARVERRSGPKTNVNTGSARKNRRAQRRAGRRRRHAEAFVEPGRRGEPGEQRQEGERDGRRPQHALHHVPELEVAELVRQHRLDLVRCKPLEQRVEEDDAPGAPEAREERVAVARAARAVHHEEPAAREAAAAEQRLDRLARGAFGQRRELVEQRRDHGGVEREQRNWNAGPASQAQIHHQRRPPRCISHRTAPRAEAQRRGDQDALARGRRARARASSG